MESRIPTSERTSQKLNELLNGERPQIPAAEQDVMHVFLTRGRHCAVMAAMPNVNAPYLEGRQPCRAFQEDKLNRPKTCPSCENRVQWCRSCLRTHHSGGWETCPGQRK